MSTLNEIERQFAEQLLLAVKNKEFSVTYSVLAERISTPVIPLNVGRNIENISALCHELGLPLLSAIVVNKKTGNAGDGFYPLYERLGIPTEGMSEKELCYKEQIAIRDCKEWYKLEDALCLQIGLPRPKRIWLYIKPDKAEYCLHAVESILTEKYHREGDPELLSFASGELARREQYKYNVAKQGKDIMQAISWGDPGIEDSKAVFQAAGNALRIIPEGWDNQQNLVDWRDVDYIWDMKATRPFTRALHKLFATDDEKTAF